ncbi:MAG: hypothetical protein ABIL25_04495 [candidate division WOR-3 bacterium]
MPTNDCERPPKDIIWFHDGRGRGNAENYDNELKSGFSMDCAVSESEG